MGLYYACTLTLLLLNLCDKTNPMWPYFNIWSFARTPASTRVLSVITIRRHPRTCPAFVLAQSQCMLACTAVESLFLVALVPSTGHR